MQPAGEAEIELATGELLALLNRHLPDLVSSLTLVGSAVDGDYRAGRSDIDLVAVMRRPANDDELEGLAIVHRLYAADPTLPRLDVIWITEPDLAAGPDLTPAGPTTLSTDFVIDAMGNRNPVTWSMLREAGRTIFGVLDLSRLWHDVGRLKSWTRQNVEDYWVHWLMESSRLTTGRGIAMLGRQAPMWGVLGISRLHATIATGRVLSKSAAGEYALATFDPKWRPTVEECLRIRRGEAGQSYGMLARRRDALAFVAMVIEAIRA